MPKKTFEQPTEIVGNDSSQDTETTSESKKCFVIMPISNVASYDEGHFDRVYRCLLKPAIESAGYIPERADEQRTNNIMIGIIKNIVEADMVLCDLSTNNPNVLYELGMRNAFEKPVVLVKDKETKCIFDIATIRYYEYHSSLRTDYVHNEIEIISKALKNYKEDEKSYSLMQQANITTANEVKSTIISQDTEIILGKLDDLRGYIFSSIRNMNCPPFANLKTEPIERDYSWGFSIGDLVCDKNDGSFVGTIEEIGNGYAFVNTQFGTIKKSLIYLRKKALPQRQG